MFRWQVEGRENDDSSKTRVTLEGIIIEFCGHVQAASGCSVAVSESVASSS